MQPLGTREVLILCMFVSKSGRTLSGRTAFTLLRHYTAMGKWPWIQQYKREIPPCDGSTLCFKHSFLLPFPLPTFLLPDTDTHREMGCFHACVITIATISLLPARVEALQCSVLRTQRGDTKVLRSNTHMYTTHAHTTHTHARVMHAHPPPRTLQWEPVKRIKLKCWHLVTQLISE